MENLNDVLVDYPWVSPSRVVASPIQTNNATLEQLAKNQRFKIPRDHLSDYDFAQQWAKDRNTKTLNYEHNNTKYTKPNYYYDPEKGKMPNKYIYSTYQDWDGTWKKYKTGENPEYAKWFDNNKNMETASTTIETPIKPLDFTFEDLNFQKLKRYADGVQTKVFFPNGYGALIQKHEDSDGYPNNYEIHVLSGKEDKHTFCYSSKLTNDYLGNLTEDQVIETLTKLYNYTYSKRVSKYPKNCYGWWYDQIVDDNICQMAKEDFERKHARLNTYSSGVTWKSAMDALADYDTRNKVFWMANRNTIETYK